MFNVMIVDDEEKIRTGIATILPWESYGFSVGALAEDGHEALALASAAKPDLVITDIRMPGMDGITLGRELRALYPELPIILLSGYNEFSYAKEALKSGIRDYLLKPIDPEELGRALETVYGELMENARQRIKDKARTKSLRDHFFARMIRDETWASDGSLEAASEHGVSLCGERYAIMLVSLETYGDYALSRTKEELGLLAYSVETHLEELVGNRGNAFELSPSLFAVLIGGTEDELGETELIRLAERIVDAAEKQDDVRLTVSCGSIVTLPAHIGRSYAGAAQALDKKFYLDSERVFLYRAEDDVSGPDGLLWDDAELLASVREGNGERVRGAVDAMFEELRRKRIPPDGLKQQSMLTVIRLAKLLEECHGDWQSFYTGRYDEVERIFRSGDVAKLKTFMHRIAGELQERIDAWKPRRTESRIREIVAMIDQQYKNELNLKELSRMFYINAVYLGQLFRKETGEYFNDYLNKVRVREAVRLLERTGMPAADVATEVGYKYVDHFYRHFKQTMGVNPGEYRRKFGES